MYTVCRDVGILYGDVWMYTLCMDACRYTVGM